MRTGPAVVLVTGEGGGALSYGAHLSALLDLDRTLAIFDLCGRSWQDCPEDLVEFIISTFKPLFCVSGGPAEVRPSSTLLRHVHWLVMRRDGNFVRIDAMEGDRIEGLGTALMGAGMLIICSSAVCRSLLGSSMRQLYLRHHARLVHFGDAPMTVRDAAPPSDSPLGELSEVSAARLEIIVLPAPGRSSMSKLFSEGGGSTDDIFGDLRVSYLKRVHHALGCEQHAIW